MWFWGGRFRAWVFQWVVVRSALVSCAFFAQCRRWFAVSGGLVYGSVILCVVIFRPIGCRFCRGCGGWCGSGRGGLWVTRRFWAF